MAIFAQQIADDTAALPLWDGERQRQGEQVRSTLWLDLTGSSPGPCFLSEAHHCPGLIFRRVGSLRGHSNVSDLIRDHQRVKWRESRVAKVTIGHEAFTFSSRRREEHRAHPVRKALEEGNLCVGGPHRGPGRTQSRSASR